MTFEMQWPRGLYGLIAVLAAATIAAALIGSAGAPVGSVDLKIALHEMRSQAVQGRLIAEAMLAGRTTIGYARGQSTFLAEKSRDTLQQLTGARSAPGFEALLASARALAERSSAAIERLLSSDKENKDIRSVRRELDEISRQTRALENLLH